MIDFDYNATTPLKPSVREAMLPFLGENYGNPSSVHRIGQRARAAVENAREDLGDALGVAPEAVVVTASGSEANSLALRGAIRPPYRDRRILSTPVEHSSVRDTLRWFEDQGASVERAPVDRRGQIDPDWFRERLDGSVDLVTTMFVNNETGVVFPVEKIGRFCREVGVRCHVDAVQAFGKRPLDAGSLPVDTLSVSAHKIGGPKGAAALVAPPNLPLEPLVFGGHQERERRGGTENVAATVGFAAAARDLDLEAMERTRSCRDTLERRLVERISDLVVVGEQVRRVPNTVGLLVPGVKGEELVMRLDLAGVAAATGAACTSGSPRPSHVLKAIPLPDELGPENFLRLSMPPEPSPETLDDVVEATVSCVEELRSSPVTDARDGDPLESGYIPSAAGGE